MNVALRRPMSRDEFLTWDGHNDGRWEFDGLQPVAMTGGSLGHSAIVVNLLQQLRTRLAGTSCRPFTQAAVATIGIEIPVAAIYEDVLPLPEQESPTP